MSKVNNKVIIWSTSDHNALGLLRQLGVEGIDVFLLIKGKAEVASKSRFCVEYIETDTIEQGCEYLLNNFKSLKEKPIIITSMDAIITYIDKNRKLLEPYFILPGTVQQGLVEKYIDKNTMTQLAVQLGIHCPMSMFVKHDTKIENFKFPCLIKPSHEKPGHYNEFKTKICKNINSLNKTLSLVRHDSEFILQEYIKTEKEVVVYGGRMMDGKTLIAGALIRDRLVGGTSHGYVTSKIPESIDISKIIAFLEHIGYYGLFGFEYGIADGNTYFFEVNLRNDGTGHFFYQAGANIPLAYVYSCVGLDYSHIKVKVVNDGWYIDEVLDFENVLRGNVSFKQWKKERKEATIFKVYCNDDLEPYNYAMKRRWNDMVKNIIISRFRIYIVRILEKFGLRK